MPRTATLIPEEPTAPDLPVAAVPAWLTRYEDDVYSWAQEQAALLRAGRLDRLDLENLAEEIADVGRSEKRALASNLEVILVHLLKRDHQPEAPSSSWVGSIEEHRDRVAATLADNPGLRPLAPKLLDEVYRFARRVAARETGLPAAVFPTENPYAYDDAMGRPIMLDTGSR